MEHISFNQCLDISRQLLLDINWPSNGRALEGIEYPDKVIQVALSLYKADPTTADGNINYQSHFKASQECPNGCILKEAEAGNKSKLENIIKDIFINAIGTKEPEKDR